MSFVVVVVSLAASGGLVLAQLLPVGGVWRRKKESLSRVGIPSVNYQDSMASQTATNARHKSINKQ